MAIGKLQSIRKSTLLTAFISVLMATLIDGCTKNIVGQPCEAEAKTVLVYENNFCEPDSVSDWILEGPGTIQWQKGKLILIPDAQQALYEKWEQAGRRKLDTQKEYLPTIQRAVRKVNPLIADRLVDDNGGFDGGHIVCWNKKIETDTDYIVEYDFKPLSPIGLGIVFFSAKGLNGQDVLSDELKPRYGAFKQYTKSDINCYHISYWANNAAVGKRDTCNLRKNSGFYCLANGNDPSVSKLDYNRKELTFTTHKIRLIKHNGQIRFYVDGQLSIDFTDKKVNDIIDDAGNVVKKDINTGSVLAGGRIGLRQMAGLKAEYSNFRVYKICK